MAQVFNLSDAVFPDRLTCTVGGGLFRIDAWHLSQHQRRSTECWPRLNHPREWDLQETVFLQGVHSLNLGAWFGQTATINGWILMDHSSDIYLYGLNVTNSNPGGDGFIV